MFLALKANRKCLGTYKILEKQNIAFAQINRKKMVSDSSLTKMIRIQKPSFFPNMFCCGKLHVFLNIFLDEDFLKFEEISWVAKCSLQGVMWDHLLFQVKH